LNYFMGKDSTTRFEPGHVRNVTRVLVLVTLLTLVALLPGIAFGQTFQQCTLSNGTASGFFGGVVISGSFTSGAKPDTSSINVSGAPNSNYCSPGTCSYTFTGPLDGAGYTQTSQMPPPVCDVEFCTPGTTIGLASLGFEDSDELFSGYGTVSCVIKTTPPPPPPPVCGVTATLTGNGTQEIRGVATPTGGYTTLSGSAHACGYEGYDWQQQVTNLPCPSPFVAAVPGNLPLSNLCPSSSPTAGALTAGNSGYGTTSSPFNDVPEGGYLYAIVATSDEYEPAGPYNPFPFYTVAGIAENPGALLPRFTTDPASWVPYPINVEDHQLTFFDGPGDPCLPTAGPLLPQEEADLVAGRKAQCGGATSTAAAGSYVAFTTALVGINPGSPPTAGPPLYQWTWTDTFNGGTLGNIGTIASLVSNTPVDPNSGNGHITITSINGVAVPPIIPPTQVSTTASGLAYSRVSKTFVGTLTIKNIGASTITTTTGFQLVLNSLPAGVTLANSMGTFNQCPYITIPTLRSIVPGQSVTVAVQFSNPSNAVINFTPEFYAGSF
jgi:hypothetical protein